MVVFDYMFYRMAVFFFRRDGSHAPRAVAFVSLSQAFLIFDFVLIIIHQFQVLRDSTLFKDNMALFGAALNLIFLLLNYWRYRRGYSELSDRWRNVESSLQRKIRGGLVVLGVILPFLSMFFLI